MIQTVTFSPVQSDYMVGEKNSHFFCPANDGRVFSSTAKNYITVINVMIYADI